MAFDSVVTMVFITLMGGGLGSLFWSRLNRIESRMLNIEGRMLNMATHEDVARIYDELVQLRTEQAVMRSDLTHVALALGARAPKASEG